MMTAAHESTKNGSNNNESTTPTKVAWTIMLYIAADDVLANFAVQSLEQLNRSACAPAGPGDNANVVVAAQFALPTSASKPKRYIFKEGQVGRLAERLIETTPMAANMSQKEALKDFIKMVYSDPKCKAEHYALILWGHGPELLLQPAAGSLTGSANSMYITPEELRKALEEVEPDRPLDFIGFDACFMSMFEMAYELRERATYMVASQQEVPDGSFPYDRLVELFRKDGEMLFRKDGDMPLASLLKKGVEAYVSTYQDFICDQDTGMKQVTLSVLNLTNCNQLMEAVRSLAAALLNAKGEAGLADLLIEARKSSQDYAGGLYVDLHDFCSKLNALLNGSASEIKGIKDACQKVLNALGVGTSYFIFDNSDKKCSHGISIYLPYLTDKQYAEVSKPLVKGEVNTRGGKGFSDAINGAAAEYLMSARRSLILDTESYYGRLQMACETSWYSFITDLWTNVLIKTAPADLDFHYSSQQSWMNISRAKEDKATLCPAEKSPSQETEMCATK